MRSYTSFFSTTPLFKTRVRGCHRHGKQV